MQKSVELSWWQKLRARLADARRLPTTFTTARAPLVNSWGAPSAASEFVETLETLARSAWTHGPSGDNSDFLFKPSLLLIRDDESLVAAVTALYQHARRWVGGLEIPHRVPLVRIAKTSVWIRFAHG